MIEMSVEKVVDLQHKFEEVNNVCCNCKLEYLKEKDGLRAIGLLYVVGDGTISSESYDIKETIELDILAPYEKLLDPILFKVKLNSTSYEFKENQLFLNLNFIVEGLKEKDETVENIENIEIDNSKGVIEDLLSDAENIMVSQHYVVAQTNDTYASIANRYGVSEKDLMQKNDFKLVEFKTLLLLP